MRRLRPDTVHPHEVRWKESKMTTLDVKPVVATPDTSNRWKIMAAIFGATWGVSEGISVLKIDGNQVVAHYILTK